MGLKGPDPGPALRAVLQMSAPLAVAGNTPFLLDQPQTCWWLEHGRIELFLVEMIDGSAQGVRRHFATVEAGTLLFGLIDPDAADPAQGHALLAVPHVDTQIRSIPQDRLRRIEGASALELAQPIDQWILAISEGLARLSGSGPVIHVLADADAELTVAAHQRVASAQGVIWLEVPRDTVRFLDVQELPEGPGDGLVPLGPASWLQNSQPLSTTGRNSGYYLPDGRLWAGLDTLHALLLSTARLSLMLADVDELNRLRRQSEAAGRDWQQGLDQLLGVLGQGAAGRGAAVSGQPPLFQAMRAVGRVEGFEVRMPSRWSRGATESTVDLPSIAQASQLRFRSVRLRAGWDTYETQAMLGFANDDGRPLAILPGAGKGVQVFDPSHGQTLRGRAALDVLATDAYAFTAPLPSGTLGLRGLLRFVWGRGRGDLWAVVLSGLVAALLGLAVPVAAAYMIDTVIPGHDQNHLVQVGLILVILGVTTFIMSYVGALAFSRFRARAGSALQAAIIDRLLRLPVGFFRDYSAGDLAQRAGAVTQIEQLISSSTSQALIGGIFAVFSFALLLYYDWRLGLWAVGATALYTVCSLLLIWLQLRHERTLARYDGRLQSLVLQLVTGIAKVRLSASEGRAFSRWAGLFSEYRRLGARTERYGNLQAVLSALFGLVPLILFFLILGKFRAPDEVSPLAVGGLAAFLSAFNNFNGSVTQMANTIAALLKAQPLLERVMPIMTTLPELSEGRDDPGVLSGAVHFDRVSFRYAPDGPLVLDDVSLSAKAGEFIAIVGASGCGKSTLIRLLLGFETVAGGSVLLDGKNVDELDILSVRRQMGIVLQNSRPMPGSLYENIVGSTDNGLEQAWEAAREAGLAEDIERMPMGMHTMVTEGGSLSGGQMQRLMIARAVINKPRILILDEATSALDNRVQAIVTESLDKLSVTRIVVAHRLSTVAKANRIYVLEAGRVVEQGDFQQLMRMNGRFAALAAAQIA